MRKTQTAFYQKKKKMPIILLMYVKYNAQIDCYFLA